MRSTTLPNNWCEATFEDVLADISNGISDSQNKEAEGIPVSRIETIATGKVNLAKIGYVSNISEIAAERYLLNPGDILFSHINSPAHIGKTAIFRSGRLYHGTNVLRIRTQRDTCTPEYFEYYCRYFRSIGEFSMNAQHAVNQSSLNQKKIKAFTLPLPPLAEQTRIAQKLDELLAQVDTLKARIDGIPAQLKRFRQSVLAAAVSGRLTEEWREKIKVKNWESVSWGEILKNSRDAFKRGPFGSALKKSMFVEHGYKVYEQYCPINDDCSFSRYYITPEKYEEMRTFSVESGDFLISCSGVSLGRITQVPAGSEPGIINQALLRVRLNESIYSDDFFKVVFRSPIFQKDLFENSTGSAIPNLKGVKELKAMPVPLPSLEEQTEIVRRVEQLFAFADQLEAKVASAKSRIDHLTQSILAKAFRGELVPQDPNDEPASELLARIQAQRAAAPKAKRGRKASA